VLSLRVVSQIVKVENCVHWQSKNLPRGARAESKFPTRHIEKVSEITVLRASNKQGNLAKFCFRHITKYWKTHVSILKIAIFRTYIQHLNSMITRKR